MKKISLIITLLIATISFSQEKTIEQLKAEKSKKEAEIAKLKKEVASFNSQIAKIDLGWKFNNRATIGGNFAGFNNWFSNAIKNSSTANIAVLVNSNANLKTEKYFWKNAGTINLAWNKIENKDLDYTLTPEDKEFKRITDVLNISSLFGYNVTKTIAISALAEYRTTLVENFNNPGFLDFGVGATWTPISELVVVVHPLNFNYIFSESETAFESSLGTKIMADYKKNFGGVKFASNLSAFLSYKGNDYSNWTWVNSLGFNLYKGLGVSVESGLRKNKQEAFNSLKAANPTWKDLSESDNPLQSYWLLGLSYSL